MAKRYFPHLIILGLLLLALLVPATAYAQDGSCPPNTVTLGGAPQGFGSAITDTCATSLSFQWIVDDTVNNHYPCDQFIYTDADNLYAPDTWEKVVLINDPTRWLSNIAHIRFYIYTVVEYAGQPGALIYPGLALHDDDQIIIEYFDSSGNLFFSYGEPASYYHWGATYFTLNGINHYYNIYRVDQFIDTDDGYGGYFRVSVDQPSFQGTAFHPVRAWGLASVMLGSLFDYLEPWCDVPVTMPATATPPPTPTIAATWTPSGSTPTPYTTPGATNPATTPQPTWTPTVFIYPTLPAESTATPWPVPQLQPLVFPTLEVPTLAPIATPAPVTVGISTTIQAEERATTTWDMFSGSIDIATRWATPVAWSLDSFDTDTGYDSGISGTVPLSSTAGAFGAALGSITYPVRFMRTVAAYMPNTWRIIVIVFGMFLVIFGNTIAKLAVTIISEVINIIRRVWEAIPLN